MEYWIIRNERPFGPLSLEGLIKAGIEPTTKVWRTGLSDWVEASSLEELEQVLNAVPPTFDTPPQSLDNVVRFTPGASAAIAPPQPPTYLWWNIAMTLCCSLLGGIIGLIFSYLSSSNYRNGNYEKAVKWSNRAELMVIISFTWGCVSWPFSLIFSGLI